MDWSLIKFYLACPWYISGGPECIHQLCSELNNLNINSYMVYDNGNNYPIPNYKNYNLKVTNEIEDDSKNCIIIPETYPPNFIEPFSKIQTAYYWLSKDNVRWNLASPMLHKYDWHICQSYYAYDFVVNELKIDKSKVFMVTDYTRDIMLSDEEELIQSLSKRENNILFNPSKGQHITHKIISMASSMGWNFIPIVNMTPEEIKNLALKSKIYIDFGHHPGKDRIPREMVSCGCSIIVGLNGSANFFQDIPISFDRKFNTINENVIQLIVQKMEKDINNFENAFQEMQLYRNQVRNEKNVFIKEIKTFLETVNHES